MMPLAALAALRGPTAEEVRRQAEKVFARPEFTPSGPNRLLEALLAFFGWLGTLHAVAPLLFWLLLGACVLLLVLLLAFIAWRVGGVFRAGERDRASAGREQRERLSASYAEEARTRAARGEYTEAIRYLFLSLVYRFDETGRVPFERAWTNREYLGLFADRQGIYSQLKVFVDALDEHWYGQRPTGQPRYEECLALYQGLGRQG